MFFSHIVPNSFQPSLAHIYGQICSVRSVHTTVQLLYGASVRVSIDGQKFIRNSRLRLGDVVFVLRSKCLKMSYSMKAQF